ncbi:MAG: hypothetical protein JOZ67_00425 [Gammaproteobacteria bacterium]|nr:hypothetical protein [Gammaproteobacteria bacterium]
MSCSTCARVALLGPILLAGAILGCSRHEATPPGAHPEVPAPAATAAGASIRASFIDGANQAQIRAYLGSVRELRPKKFEVEWSKDVVPVSRDETMRALRAVNADGSVFTFSSSEPVVQRLQPGKIVWIWDIAIRRIDRVGVIDDATLVHTSAVPLNEAIPRADIEFASPIDFSAAYGVRRPRPVNEPKPRTITSARAAGGALRPVRYEQGPDPGSQPSPAPEDPSLTETEDTDLVTATRDGYEGKVAGFEFSVGYTMNQQKLSVQLQARKEDESQPAGGEESDQMLDRQKEEFFQHVEEQHKAEHAAHQASDRIEKLETELAQIEARQSGKPAGNAKLEGLDSKGLNTLRSEDEQQKLMAISDYRHDVDQAEIAQQKAKQLADLQAKLFNLFEIVSDNVDIRFRARADLDRAALDAAIKLAPGSNAGTAINFNDLAGSVDLEIVARLGKGGNAGVSIPVAHVPIMFNIPMPVGGLPLVAQVAADFLCKVALGGNHAAHHFHARFKFAGSGGLSASGSSQTNSNFNLSGKETEPEVEEPTASSPGVSGTVLAVQLPRIGLGLGVWGAAAVAYTDLVTVLTLTNSASVATLNPPCVRMTVDRVAHVGADVTTLLPIPIVTQLLQALSFNKEVWRAKQWIRVKPDIQMCRI